MITIYTWSDGTELYHHGILGQKWGIRRYQNYDGSYTKAGMKRYNKALSNYENANERYKNAKKNKSSDTELTNARLARSKAKKQLKKDYRHLRQDKLADQGKKLYSKEHRIFVDRSVTRALLLVGGLTLSAAKNNYDTYGSAKVTNVLSAIGGLTLGAAAVKNGIDNINATRLRAYYTHTSNY